MGTFGALSAGSGGGYLSIGAILVQLARQVLVVNIYWYNIGEAGSGGGVKIIGECRAILVGSSTCCLGKRIVRW